MKLWKIEKEYRFEASHILEHHDGKCARLHGHSWRAKITFASAALEEEGPKRGMVADFGEISRMMKPIIDNDLDHHHLNSSLVNVYPTSENVARWLFERINAERTYFPRIPPCVAVEIAETCTSKAQYIDLDYLTKVSR